MAQIVVRPVSAAAWLQAQSAQLGFVVEKVAVGHVLVQLLSFSLVSIIPLCSIFIRVLFAGCSCILQTGHITLSSATDQQLKNHSTKYHRQQPLYNTLELLMMGIVVPETC